MGLEKILKIETQEINNKRRRRRRRKNYSKEYLNKKKRSYSNLYLEFNELQFETSNAMIYQADVILNNEEIGDVELSIDYEEKTVEWISFYPYSKLNKKIKSEEELDKIKKKINYIGTITHFISIDQILFNILDFDHENILEWRSQHDWFSVSDERKKHLVEILYKEYGIKKIDDTPISNLDNITLIEEYETIYNYLRKKNVDIKSLNTKLDPEYVIERLYPRILENLF